MSTNTKLVPVQSLADTLGLSMNQLRVLIESGYLAIEPGPTRKYHKRDWSKWMAVAKDPVGELDLDDPDVRLKLQKRVQRIIRATPARREWAILWRSCMARSGSRALSFHRKVLTEINRVAKLKEPMRTEQAIRLLLATRDAKTIAIEALDGARLSRPEIKISANQQKRLEEMEQRIEKKLARMTGLDIVGEPLLNPIPRYPQQLDQPTRRGPRDRPASPPSLLAVPHGASALRPRRVEIRGSRRLPETTRTGIWQIFDARPGGPRLLDRR